MALSHSQHAFLGHSEKNMSGVFHFHISSQEMARALSLFMCCCKLKQLLEWTIYKELAKVKSQQYTCSENPLHATGLAWETNTGKGAFSTVCWKRMVNIVALSQWNGCHSGTCVSMIVAWGTTEEFNIEQNSLSHSLQYEVQSALYKTPCQWNSLGQLHVFLFFS